MRATPVPTRLRPLDSRSRRVRTWVARLFISAIVAGGVFVPATVTPVNAAAATFSNSDIVAVSAGGYVTCVVKGIGPTAAVYCWGANGSGQLGDGTTTTRNTPVAVADNPASGFQNDNIVGVVVGGEHTCALRTESGFSKLYCWGKNVDGRLGDGTTTTRTKPVAVASVTGGYTNTANTSLALGVEHTCVTQGVNDILYCWGNGLHGRLGDGNTAAHTVLQPRQVDDGAMTGGNTGVTEVDAGQWHTCARKGGEIYCWGDSQYGQLGDDQTTTDRSAPVALVDGDGGLSASLGNSGWTGIDVSQNHSCATNGNPRTLYCWGFNSAGQLGLGNGINADTNTVVLLGDRGGADVNIKNPGGPIERTVAAGGSHTCAIGASEKVFCWGFNSAGQLGDGTVVGRNAPIEVSAGAMTTNASIKSVAAGATHTCAIKGAGPVGVVYCWGENFIGSVGDGTLTNRNTPVLVVTGIPLPEPGPAPGSSPAASAGPSLYWMEIDTTGGICAIDGSNVTMSGRVPFLGYRYIPSSDECSRSGYSFSGWARRTAPTVVVDLPRLIDETDGRRRYFIADHYDLVAVWVTPGRTSLILQ